MHASGHAILHKFKSKAVFLADSKSEFLNLGLEWVKFSNLCGKGQGEAFFFIPLKINLWFYPLSLEKEMANHSSILAWKIPWTKEPSGLQSMGLQTAGHDWVTNTTHRICLIENRRTSGTIYWVVRCSRRHVEDFTCIIFISLHRNSYKTGTIITTILWIW